MLGGDENLAAIGARAGAANLPEDDRGVLRRFRYQEGGLDTLAVAVAKRAGRDVARDDFASGGAWIDYRGPARTIPTVSFANVIRGKFDPASVRGRVVVIGATAPTLHDVHPTSVSGGRARWPGPRSRPTRSGPPCTAIPLRSLPGPVGILAIIALGLAVPLAACRIRLSLAALGGRRAGRRLSARGEAPLRRGHAWCSWRLRSSPSCSPPSWPSSPPTWPSTGSGAGSRR